MIVHFKSLIDIKRAKGTRVLHPVQNINRNIDTVLVFIVLQIKTNFEIEKLHLVFSLSLSRITRHSPFLCRKTQFIYIKVFSKTFKTAFLTTLFASSNILAFGISRTTVYTSNSIDQWSVMLESRLWWPQIYSTPP